MPLKILAGWKFQRRNPASAPASAKHRTAISGWLTWVVRLMSPSVTAGDQRDAGGQAVEPVDPVDAVDHADDPEDREPDRERLAEPDDAVAERVVDHVDPDPERDRQERQPELASELPARAQVEQVVDAAERRGGRAAHEQRDEVARLRGSAASAPSRRRSLSRTNPPATIRNAAAMARPPARGIGRVLTRRAFGRSTIRRRSDDPPDERRQDEREERGGDEDGDDRPDAGRRPPR